MEEQKELPPVINVTTNRIVEIEVMKTNVVSFYVKLENCCSTYSISIIFYLSFVFFLYFLVKGRIEDNYGCKLYPDLASCKFGALKTFYFNSNAKADSEFYGISASRDEKIERLNAEYCRLMEYIPLGISDRFPNLIEIKIQRSSVKKVSKDVFAGLRKLKLLNLESNQIQTIDENSFNDLVSLEELDLRTNKITMLPRKILHHLRSLEILNLQNNPLVSIHDDFIDNLQKLKKVYLNKNKISSLPSKCSRICV